MCPASRRRGVVGPDHWSDFPLKQVQSHGFDFSRKCEDIQKSDSFWCAFGIWREYLVSCPYALAVLRISLGSSALWFFASYGQLFAHQCFQQTFEGQLSLTRELTSSVFSVIFLATKSAKFIYWTRWTTGSLVLIWFHVPGAPSPEKRRHGCWPKCIIFLNAIFSLRLPSGSSVKIETS